MTLAGLDATPAGSLALNAALAASVYYARASPPRTLVAAALAGAIVLAAGLAARSGRLYGAARESARHA